ncbi:MAG: hypothetical protein JWM68_4665 [Verrucomicrobiales bacterium]|nr:hypothetical protein [Verrucomicrobiales bacterium]
MKKYLGILTALAVSFTLSSHAQRGGMGPSTPQFGGAMSKYFGDNSNFSSDIEMQSKDPQGNAISIPGKMAFSDGKVRFEMNLAEMKSGNKPSPAAAQMKAMGMESMVTISQPAKKVSLMIYPGMKAYLEMPVPEADASENPKEDYKMEMTELGKETIDGHPCVKNKAVVSDKKGTKHEATIWNATDLKNFPVKLEQTEQGQHTTMLFKKVQFAKPDAAQFEAPAEYKKYDDMQEMMQEIMMKKLGGGQGFAPPPAQP